MPTQQTKPADYPQAVIAQIAQLAQNIVIARKRRKESQVQWAKKLGVSQPTMARIEKGDPSVAMASYVMCVWLINPSASLSNVIAPESDLASLEREISRVCPRRAHQTSSAPPADIKATDNTRTAAGLAALLTQAAPRAL